MGGMRSSLEQARARGRRAAMKEHVRLSTDLARPIDVFKIITDAKVMLMFQPLPRLFGLYDDGNGRPGILINGNHPLPLQRFTASHEYGHHVLGHHGSWDREESIYDSRFRDLREIEAQAFAAQFLMPLQLVNRTLRDMALPTEHPAMDPETAYQLSVRLGASYRAIVSQLYALKKIDYSLASRLRDRRHRPIDMKAAILGIRPEDPRAQVWALDQSDDGAAVEMQLGDFLCLTLKARPSSGYVWRLQEGPTVDALAVVREDCSSSHERIGQAASQRFVIRAESEGSREVEVSLQRPWNEDVRASLTLSVRISPSVIGEAKRGIASNQRPQLVGA